MNEKLIIALNEISEQYIDEAAKYKKSRSTWFAAVAAILIVAIAGYLFKEHLSPNSSPSQSIYFNSIEELQGLIDAAESSEEEYRAYAESLPFYYYGNALDSRQGAQEFAAFLDNLLLPCHSNSFYALYYYPSTESVEVFYKVNGIRYQFMSASSTPQFSGDPVITDVRIDDIAFDLYANDQRLSGSFVLMDRIIQVTAITSDPDDIDFSGFYLGKILD